MSKKIALVFGGTRGIGAATVQKLAESGYDVAYTYVSSAPSVPAKIGSSTTKGYKVDIREPAQVAQVFADVANDFGSAPHCVVANAGINVPPGPIATYDAENFRKVVEVNLVGAFNVLSAAAKNVVDGGNIIGLTTSMVRMSIPGVGAYTATKAAVESLLRSMSKELASRKIRVNGVAPGPVDTDLFRAGKDEATIARSAGMSPFNRVGQPEEVAEVVAFLASDKASWVHGQIIQPNGGMV
jgi:3-oxoacyl-[acyl-carrier protein] reductase